MLVKNELRNFSIEEWENEIAKNNSKIDKTYYTGRYYCVPKETDKPDLGLLSISTKCAEKYSQQIINPFSIKNDILLPD
jgi:hypothetical protein